MPRAISPSPCSLTYPGDATTLAPLASTPDHVAHAVAFPAPMLPEATPSLRHPAGVCCREIGHRSGAPSQGCTALGRDLDPYLADYNLHRST